MIHDLFDYNERAALEARETFIDLPYMHDLCEALEQCITGRLPGGAKNLLINIAPRCYKTTITSQRFVSWCMAEIAPDCEFILTSYAADLAIQNAMAVKRLIRQPWHAETYPHVSIAREERDIQKTFRTTSDGVVYATGMEGTITGFGAGKARPGFGGAIIIDDPTKAADFKSAVMRENAIKFYLSTLKTRRNSVDDTPIILIMQRLHVDDLSGWVIKNEPKQWHKVVFPAEQDGKLLNPVTMSHDELDTLRIVDPNTYYSQYQQSPIVPSGSVIKLPWWRTYKPSEYQRSGLRIITADTAYAEKDDNDQSVFHCWDLTDRGMFFVESMYGRWDFPQILSNARLFYNMMPDVKEFFVEDKATGTPLEQMLTAAGVPAVAWNPRDFEFPPDKLGRTQAASWPVHGGSVYLPEGDVPVRISTTEVLYVTPGAAALMEEAALFARDMSHAHDDQVDAFSMAVSVYLSAGGKATQ